LSQTLWYEPTNDAEAIPFKPGSPYSSKGRPMRIVAFEKNGGAAIGVRLGEEVVDLATAAPDLPQTLRGLLTAGPDAMSAASEAADNCPERLALQDLALLPPIQDPPKIMCIGRNYAEHAKEGGADVPEYPDIFMRSRLSLLGHGQPIIRPPVSDKLDFEGELLAVIGSHVHRADEAWALAAVAGYAVFNDATLRDYQRRTGQWTIGKNFDNTGAFGPEFVTADELPPGCTGLRLQTRLNGEVMQDTSTDDMVFPVVPALVTITEAMSLEPGDLLATGTPSGVGYARKPPVWMKPGDTVEVEIEGIGILSNPIEDEV
jgi:acylpyruvate hydrolase